MMRQNETHWESYLSKERFIGYCNKVYAGGMSVHIPSSSNLSKFINHNAVFNDSSLNTYVLIESSGHFFLGTINEEEIAEKERLFLTSEMFMDGSFHPVVKVDVISEIDKFRLTFERTIKNSPVIGSKVYLATEKLVTKYVKSLSVHRDMGEIPSTKNLAKLLQIDQVEFNTSFQDLFDKHLGIIGSTGSGKSNTAAKLMLELIRSEQKVIVLDPTGEYSNVVSATNDIVKVKLGENFKLHYWEFDDNELGKLFRVSLGIQGPKLRDAIRSLQFIKQNNKFTPEKYNGALEDEQNIRWGKLKRVSSYESLRADVGLFGYEIERPYDFSKLYAQLYEECVDFRVGTKDKNGEVTGLKPDGGAWNFCSPLALRIANFYHDRINGQLFSDSTEIKNDNSDGLPKTLNALLSSEHQVVYINLENLTMNNSLFEVVGDLIARKLLEKARTGEYRESPRVCFMDEAHHFLKRPQKDDAYVLDNFNLIAKEGRKYGLFLSLITQSPTDLSRDILTQFGTFIIHHLSNKAEKEIITSALPTNSRLDKYLSILNTGEAIINSNNLTSPMMIKINLPSILPESKTPRFK